MLVAAYGLKELQCEFIKAGISICLSLILDLRFESIFLDRYIFQRTKISHSRWKILFYKISSTMKCTMLIMKCTMLIILIIMAEHGFGQSDNNFSQETNLYSNRFLHNETYNKKIRLTKSRTLYYANTIMTLRLITSGDKPGNQ